MTGGNAIVNAYDRQMLAPGVELVSVDRIQPGGRLEFDVLVADLGSGAVKADYLYPGTVSDAEAISDMIEDADAVAGVNGSFFDINASKAPSGVGVSEEDGIVTIPAGTGNGEITSSNIPIVFTPKASPPSPASPSSLKSPTTVSSLTSTSSASTPTCWVRARSASSTTCGATTPVTVPLTAERAPRSSSTPTVSSPRSASLPPASSPRASPPSSSVIVRVQRMRLMQSASEIR
ncbi:hypothetical protein [Flaviflexus ciconiae]|uniref:hypothetical protein n=1 Tax=Flaviflexus ciconiae TaxID=2496867 RepID=UPI001D17F867|nr:hypothetical protein [Flaviflexus ciconiae]